MDIYEFDNKIVILNDSSKKSFLSKINSSKKLVNVKIITLNELKKKYYFDYGKEAIYYVCQKYNIIYDVAKMYIDNLYFINNKSDNKKINDLFNLKEELISNGLLKENKLFRNFLINKDIIIYNLKYIDKFYTKIFDELKKISNVIELNEEYNSSIKDLYKANNIEDEVSFVASSICDLVNNGVSVNNIKLANVNDSYYFIINKTFKLFNIPIELPSNETIKGTKIVNIFKEKYTSNISETIELLRKHIISDNDQYIFKQIINIVNSYNFIDDYSKVKDYIFHDIDLIKTKIKKYKNSVRLVDFENDILMDEYIFLINYNEGVIPYNYKDEDYLNDKEKESLGLSTSYDLNNNSLLNIKERIYGTKNLVVTYSTHNNSGEVYISNSYDKELFNEKDVSISYKYSNAFNKLRLVSLKDNNAKYGTISDDLVLLNSKYKNEKYLSFDNKYSMIDKNKMYDFIGKKLSLSYTSISAFYECQFKYYLNYILKINKYEDSFEIVIGNIFHKILSECFIDSFDFDVSWNREIESTEYVFNNMELFFLSTLKEQLLLVIETIKNQLKYSSLTKTMYEKKITININEDLHITFIGFVDKIMYEEFNGKTILAIIDYKTGNPILNINNAIYGLEMQLPVYIYLTKNMTDISNVKIGGFYLQKILNNVTDIDKRIDSLKLQGYSNSDEDILEKVDSSYNNSKVIKSMRTTSNGFYAYSKTINDEQIDLLSNIVKDKIIEASDKIINSSFEINPKEINNKLIGCNYCKFKDICYMNNKDIVKLKESKDILGGEVNDNMD